MKKLLLVLAILLSGIIVQAQNTFAPVGAEWWYQGSVSNIGFQNPHSSLRIRSIGDTIVQGKAARKVQQNLLTHHYYVRTPGDPTNPTNDYYWQYTGSDSTERFLYIYNNADTVFAYNELFDKFTPLYVFNVSAGDTVQLPVFKTFEDFVPVFNSTGIADSNFKFVVDSIRTEYFDSEALKTFYVTGISDSINDEWFNTYAVDWRVRNYPIVGAYTQKFGGTACGLLPAAHLTYSQIPYDGYHIFDNIKFNCYKDAQTNIGPIIPNAACDFLPLSLITQPSKGNLLIIMPNPATEQVTLRLTEALPKGSTIQLLDMTGRTLKSLTEIEHQQNITIDIRTLPPGLYMVRLQSQGQSSYKKLVVQ